MSRENLQSNIGDEKSAFLTRMRDEAAIVHAPEFALLSRMYLSKIPLCGAAAFRLAGGIEGILINYDYFQQTLGVDYTNLIPYEVEHEAQELWFLRKKNETNPLGEAHYRAIKEVMKKAHKDGNLDAFLEFKNSQMRWFRELGDSHADEELAYYYQVDDQLRGFTISQQHGRLKARVFGAGWIVVGSMFATTFGIEPTINAIQTDIPAVLKAISIGLTTSAILTGGCMMAEGAHDLITARHHSLSYPLINKIKERYQTPS